MYHVIKVKCEVLSLLYAPFIDYLMINKMSGEGIGVALETAVQTVKGMTPLCRVGQDRKIMV